MVSLIWSIIKYREYYNEERIINKSHLNLVMYKTKLVENKNYSVKYSKSYKPMVKIYGEGSAFNTVLYAESFFGIGRWYTTEIFT